ncbi:LysR substrate-binding domain-containing protein, partial [Rubrivivax gelatinosus]|uniref:LysR substrate-binding domain-containing protein n=1 Tax=Rubrivivax gelatinosus TaxID=28068 RepID=UPI001ED8E92C
AAADDPLAAPGRRLDCAELRDARWLLREPGSGTREAVEQALLPRLDHFSRTLQFDSNEALLQGRWRWAASGCWTAGCRPSCGRCTWCTTGRARCRRGCATSSRRRPDQCGASP